MTAQRTGLTGTDDRGRKLSTAERAYRDLKARVMNSELPPGASFFEPELAEMLGVNRTIAHEAAALLERDGLVELRPRRGMRVRPLAAEDMREIYDILIELEALAAEQAARRGVSEPEAAAMAAVLEEMEKALAGEQLQAGALEDWAAADGRFHAMLAELSGSRRLIDAIAMHWDQAHRARLATLTLRPPPTASNADHRALFDALLAGDADRARAIHRAHRITARDMLVEILAKHKFTRL